MAEREPQFNLRMSPELKKKIAEDAKINGRSINSEILYRIEAFEEIVKLKLYAVSKVYAEQDFKDLSSAEIDATFHSLIQDGISLAVGKIDNSAKGKPISTFNEPEIKELMNGLFKEALDENLKILEERVNNIAEEGVRREARKIGMDMLKNSISEDNTPKEGG